jgi:phenylpropionate dioxygenase-like ring-hydroxylating dioxygenase large terminal subunit
MIPNLWYAILASKEVKTGRPVGFTRMGEKMVAWRDAAGKVGVLSDLCAHRGVALSAGKLVGDCVQCPFHGFEFDTSGKCTLIPANGKAADVPKAFRVKAYPVQEAHGFIYLWWGEPRDEYPPLPFFDAIDEAQYSHATLGDLWKTHYSRAIENQLDVVHLPFVHANSIGRGGQTLVHGPRYQVEERPGGHDIIHLWYDNEVDTGQTPRKPNQMPPTEQRPLIQVQFPNLWHNWLTDNLHLLIAFAPIDDANCLLYIRQYQGFVKAPIVRDLVNALSMVGNFYIERQDRRVVLTQRPLRTDLNIGEKLIPGDAPVIEYRRRRRQMIDASLTPTP